MDGGSYLMDHPGRTLAGLPIPPLSAGSLDCYINSVLRTPHLELAEELHLAQRLRDVQDLHAAARLVLANLRHVVHIARGYLGYGLPLGDLIQEGNIGLMKAVRRYDPQHGVRLIAFAVHWIKAAIHDFVITHWRIVKSATTKAQRKLFFKLRSSKSHLGSIRLHEAEALAQELGVGMAEVMRMDVRMTEHDLSLDAPRAPGHDETPLGETLASAQDTATAVEEEQWQASRVASLHDALAMLDARARDIIERRWLCAEGHKAELQELADEYGVSAERIRQIQNQALVRMRHLMGRE